MARPEGWTKEELEARRKQAIRLLNRTDMSVAEVAEVEGVSRQSVNDWKIAYEKEGMEGLEAKPSGGGREPELPEEKLPELEELLLEGAGVHDFEGDSGHSLASLGFLRSNLTWTSPPTSLAITSTNSAGVINGHSVALPSATLTKSTSGAMTGNIAKKALRCNETIAFIDETAFRLVPTLHRTWAPKGETPFIETTSSTDPVAVISALSYTPETGDCELYFRSQQEYFDGDSIFAFLRDVAEFLSRDVMFILDNLPAHFPGVAQLRDKSDETATSVAVEWFPTYAPELNPTEFVWREAKYVELANYAPKDLDTLQRRVGRSLTPKHDHQSFLRSWFGFAELDLMT